VYAGSRPAVAAILSGAVANIGGYGLLRFGAGDVPDQLQAGGPCPHRPGRGVDRLRRRAGGPRGDTAEMLAYSAIGQVGYVLVALGVGGPVGLAAAVLYSWSTR
jgi:multicomponent Na+:H+ antiporter subunit D